MIDVKKLLQLLRKHYGRAKTALKFRSPHECLVATILSAQCTDERVNKVTPELFKKYRNVAEFASADIRELEQAVRSTGFFRNKAANIKRSAQMIVEKFGGKLPRTMDEMLELPGVARKTANVVLHNSYGVVEGVVVDTHVGRLSRRLGLSKEKSPEKVEKDLMSLVPRGDWANIAYWLIDHGRAVCKSQKPSCGECFLAKMCPSAGKFNAKGKWVGPK